MRHESDPAPAHSKMRILVVEDHRDGAESLAALLRMSGHEAHVAFDGPAALRDVRESPPDVVLLDIGLPGGMDGYEVARRLREVATEKEPFLIAVTGRKEEDDLRKSAEVGIDLHLVKPLDFERLQPLLERFARIVLPPE